MTAPSPSLSELFQRYLQSQSDAHAQGLGLAEPVGDVMLHEAVPIQPIDPRQAWEDALAVLAHFPGVPKQTFTVPSDWPTLIGSQESALALPFCLGNTPQMVRNLQPLLAGGDLGGLRMPQGRTGMTFGVAEQARTTGDVPTRLLAAGVLRLSRRFDEAAKLLHGITGDWQAVAANEAAALAWHQGQTEEALDSWKKQKPTAPVSFNRGMASLFLGDAGTAVSSLTPAAAAIPEASAWHHLGRLYLALAEARQAP